MTPRSRVTIYVGNHVQVDSYTCPTSSAHERALAECEALGDDAYAIVASLDGSIVYRIPERDGVVSMPSGGLRILSILVLVFLGACSAPPRRPVPPATEAMREAAHAELITNARLNNTLGPNWRQQWKR